MCYSCAICDSDRHAVIRHRMASRLCRDLHVSYSKTKAQQERVIQIIISSTFKKQKSCSWRGSVCDRGKVTGHGQVQIESDEFPKNKN